MIKAENGSVNLRGNAIDLFGELGLIIRALRYDLKDEVQEERFDAMLQTICEDSKKSNEQLLEELKELRKENAKKLLQKKIKDFFKEDEHE